jgi:hypothetical protein
MQKTIDDDVPYEIIELNESEPIVFQRDMKKEQDMKTVNGENNKKVILVIPKEITTSVKTSLHYYPY